MVFCHPATQCCCGCSLDVGIKLLLLANLLHNLFYIYASVTAVGYHDESYAYSTSWTVMIGGCWFALAGIPIMFLAYWGLPRKTPAPLWCYLYYLVLVCVYDVWTAMKDVILSGPCGTIPPFLESHGNAFACGAKRVADLTIFVLITSIQIYLIHVVWSKCEDLETCAGSPDLSDLWRSKEPYKQPVLNMEGAYSSLVGFASEFRGTTKDSSISAFAGPAPPGFGGAPSIFQGTFHEMEYPPSRGRVR